MVKQSYEHLIRVLAICLFCIIGVSSAMGSSYDESIKNTFDELRGAIYNKDINRTRKILSSSSKEYLEDIRNKSLALPATGLMSLSLLEKFYILLTRQLYSAEELKVMSPAELYLDLILKDNLQEKYLKDVSIENVIVTEDKAKAEFTVNGKKSDVYLPFVLESGDWKIDLVSLYKIADNRLRKEQLESTFDEIDYLHLRIKRITNQFSITLFNPLLKKNNTVMRLGDKYQGTIMYGAFYAGEIIDGEPTNGILYFLSHGFAYEGGFKNGFPSGYGEVYSIDAAKPNVRIKANWDGLNKAKGVATYGDGSTFEGEFLNLNPNGEGICTKDNNVSRCIYKDGELVN